MVAVFVHQASAAVARILNPVADFLQERPAEFLAPYKLRLANLAAGPTDPTDATYTPTNAVGGALGISSSTAAQLQISGMTGTYQVCSAGILGKFAKQLDIQMDDGNTATGSLRVVDDAAALGTAGKATNAVDDASNYTVCMTF